MERCKRHLLPMGPLSGSGIRNDAGPLIYEEVIGQLSTVLDDEQLEAVVEVFRE